MFYVGRLGFQFEDLSIPFDGGYRIASGQQPYVDFMAPNGPVLFLQQAVAFQLFGVSLSTFLWHAALLNALTALMVWRLLTRWGRGLATIGTLATACWFYLPPGAPYIDTTAFFWTLVGLWALAKGRGHTAPAPWDAPPPAPSPAQWRWLAVAGTAASLACLTKQNIGALALGGLGLLLILDLWDHRWKRAAPGILAFAAGAALPWLLLAMYLTWSGGWSGFVYYVWEVPAASGRLKMLIPWSGRMVIKAVLPDAVGSTFAYMLKPALLELAVYGLAGILAWRWWRSVHAMQRFWLAAMVFLLLQQQWSYNTSNNNAVLYWPFAGLLWGWVGGLLWLDNGLDGGIEGGLGRSIEGSPSRSRRTTVYLASGLLLALAGWGLSVDRQAHDLKPTNLGPPLEHPRLEGLRLYPQEGRDLVQLLDFLESQVPEGATYWVFGDPSVLYGVTGHTPPPGLLWYRDGVSYLAGSNASAEGLLEGTLQRLEVRWVVVDRLGQETLLDHFPVVRQRLQTSYPERRQIGSFQLYGRSAHAGP